MTKKLKITGKIIKYALVDDDMFDYLNQWKWNINKEGYVKRGQYTRTKDGKYKRTEVKLHRLVLQTPKGMVTDHINGNKLDNRRENLRICTQQQNTWNQKPYGKSGVVGVWFDKARNKYVAHIGGNGKKTTIGRYNTLEEAIDARDTEARKRYGDFAYQNGGTM